MRIYTLLPLGGWRPLNVNVRRDKIAIIVTERYGQRIIERNTAYDNDVVIVSDADSPGNVKYILRSEYDRMVNWQSREYGQFLASRVTSRPYDKTQIDARYRARRAAYRERRMGV